MTPLKNLPAETHAPHQLRQTRALTLTEAMVAMFIMGTFLLGFLSTALSSRRITEASVMQAAATSMVYGLLEQLKMIPYESVPLVQSSRHPYQDADAFKDGKPATAYTGLCLRLNQDQVTCLECVLNTDSSTFLAPLTAPATLTGLDADMMNIIGPISLSSTTGTASQPLTLRVWAWVDNIADPTNDVADAKCITLIYSYQYNDGNGLKTVINREVLVRTKYAALRTS